ncbi:amidohydrolase family protein [Glaciecola sp. MH2013]|uniref:amidohydrolase family protein n=1 Tax=Glaciecola sp. MH2013 TaxID=2785524 RepID=UPI00189F8A78|nr:amidohydrolase family protein [Glaciecola sp. MH2013]MBF7073155.1 amidohydrolase family protein [Glaciecola sp. MH2013]
MSLLKKMSLAASIALSLGLSAAAYAEKIAIVGGQVHTVSSAGVLEEATVLINNGRIQQVVEGDSVPSGYREIDARGKVVTPGFIGAYTSLGLEEVSGSAGTVDARTEEHPISTLGAAFDVQFAINNDSSLIPITRIEGFTSAGTALSSTGQLFQGQGAVISLAGKFDSILKAKAYMQLDVSNGGADDNGGSRAAMWVAIHTAFEEAKFAQSYTMNPSADWHGLTTMADAKALIPVLNGQVPLFVKADRAADISQMLKLKLRFADLRLVLVHGVEAWRMASELAAANVPVILNPEYNLPGSFDQLGATLENAARLHKAGVKVVVGMDTHNIRLATQHAGNAVANGLPHSAGIASLTINAAEIFGLEEQIGSLEPGKDADVVIWSGDPLEVAQTAEQVFIQGKEIDMSSRQTKLRDRYLKRNKALPVGYTRP